MMERKFITFIFIFVFTILQNFSHGYKNVRLQDFLCSDKLIIALQKPFRGDPMVTLTEHDNSAALISQIWNSTFPGIFSSNKIKHDCHFRVLTADRPRRGIYTVITLLKFRVDTITGKCLDYIQFSNGNRSPSARFCTNISADGPGHLILDQRDRDVSVHIHIDKKHIIKEPLELRMVLTAYSECRASSDEFQCDLSDSYSCISKQFVRDNITNCLSPCRDEVTCFHDAVTTEDVGATNVALSALTSLIFTMLGIGFCVWICWKYWNCITEQQHAHEASAAARRYESHVLELPTSPNLNNMNAVNHHYNQQQISNSISTNEPQYPPTPKDLPPSYESLFPDR